LRNTIILILIVVPIAAISQEKTTPLDKIPEFSTYFLEILLKRGDWHKASLFVNRKITQPRLGKSETPFKQQLDKEISYGLSSYLPTLQAAIACHVDIAKVVLFLPESLKMHVIRKAS
jgi:hypothetical protein